MNFFPIMYRPPNKIILLREKKLASVINVVLFTIEKNTNFIKGLALTDKDFLHFFKQTNKFALKCLEGMYINGIFLKTKYIERKRGFVCSERCV